MKIAKEIVKNKDVKTLCLALFPHIKAAVNITPKQAEIVRKIAFAESNRLCINAMTRYGKSQCVALGVALYILFRENKKIALIAPTNNQTEILRNYIGEIIATSIFYDLIDLDKGIDRRKFIREASRKRLTFKNGCELRTLSAHGEAEGLMGFGADLTICDESALISRNAYAKIVRMLGDDPEKSILIELSNPWNIDNKYYEHYTSGRFDTLHIGYNEALSEGRVTQTFIDEMKAELTPIEFTVLYESQFPDEAEDSLFKLQWVKQAEQNNFNVSGTKIISCDVAEKGRDLTVIMYGEEQDGVYKLKEVYSEAISDPMGVANKIVAWYNQKGADIINIDCIGIGSGVISRVKEQLKGQNVTINACHYGEKPSCASKFEKDRPGSAVKRFMNKKAEQYFRLRTLFEDCMLDIPENAKLRGELMKMKWDRTSGEKIKIIDPEDKSPDFADALVYFVWKANKNISWFSG